MIYSGTYFRCWFDIGENKKKNSLLYDLNVHIHGEAPMRILSFNANLKKWTLNTLYRMFHRFWLITVWQTKSYDLRLTLWKKAENEKSGQNKRNHQKNFYLVFSFNAYHDPSGGFSPQKRRTKRNHRMYCVHMKNGMKLYEFGYLIDMPLMKQKTVGR